MISGFVIFFTLDNTQHFGSFWKKRLIRLIPSMVIASLITFTVLMLFDHSMLFPPSHEVKNFFPSLTFISPELLNKVTGQEKGFEFINGSYWSLWTEIQFYLYSSILFYINREKFLRNFIICSVVLVLVNYLLANILTGSNMLHVPMGPEPKSYYKDFYRVWIFNIFNLVTYLPFFAMGVLFYLLFKNKHMNVRSSWFIKSALVIFMLFAFFSGKNEVRFIYLLMFLLFCGFVYYPDKFFIFEARILTTIGVSSYFLYLIHENIGVFLINRFAGYFAPVGFIFSLLVIVLLVVLSWLFTEKIDNKLNKVLKKRFH